MQPFTLPDLLEHNLSERADKIALLHGEESVTYGELAREVERWARKLAALGVEREIGCAFTCRSPSKRSLRHWRSRTIGGLFYECH